MTDRQIVQRTLDGDRLAFGELVDRYRHMAYGLGYHLTGEFEAARDVAQEAFIQAYLKLAQLRDPEKFAGWLRRIILNVQRSQLRTKKVVTVGLEDEDQSIRQAPQPSDIEIAVRDALAGLSEPDRLALTLHYINGYSGAEIAGFLGVLPDTVKTRLARARQRLKKEIKAMVEDTFEREHLPEDFTTKTVAEALRRGQAALADDDYEAALAAFGEATVLRPESSEAHAGLGAAWTMRNHQIPDPGTPAKARAEFEEALRHDPRNEAALVGLAEMETDKRQAYERALKVLPESAELRYRFAWAVHEDGQTEEAVRMLTAMLDEGIPASARVRIHNNLGCFYHDELGDPGKGREHLRLAAETAEVAEAKVSSFFHWRVYACTALRDHEWQEALSAASRVLDRAPTDFEHRNLHVLIAAAKANLHQPEEAIQHLAAAATPGPEPPGADRWPFRVPANADPLDWVRRNPAECFSNMMTDPRFKELIGK